MHEFSLCISLMRQVERVAREHRAERVDRIRLRLGPLSGVEPGLLAAAWPLAAAGTLAEGAELETEPAPVTVSCIRCGEISEAQPNRLLCAACGDYRTRLVSGDELLLVQVELSQAEPAAESLPCV